MPLRACRQMRGQTPRQPDSSRGSSTTNHELCFLPPVLDSLERQELSLISLMWIMAARCFSRRQIRLFGILVEGANFRSRPHERAALSLSKARPVAISRTCHSVRSLATTRGASPPRGRKPSSPRTAEQVLAEELDTAASVLKSDAVPSEVAVQRALKICENLARSVEEPIESPETPPRVEKTPTSNLLSLDEQSQTLRISSPTETLSRQSLEDQTVDMISSTAYSIVTDPKVFITPALLATYLYAQSILGRPESFPQIFDLYASKSIPQPGSLPIKYKEANPNRASSAVPLVLAHTALTAAIEAKDLTLCLSIIDTSVCTMAYKRSKLLRRAFLPFSGLALAPAAAYVLAAQLAQYQHSMDNQMATNMAFAGILAYVGFTATIGVVAIATANDQMDRITWAMGTPLRERWLREEERALVDRVAGAWGFQDENKRGEEEGGEWEALREWALIRGMILDKPELMEGME